MNPIISNYLNRLKSKQLKDYTISELQDKALDLVVLYQYSDAKEDKEALRPVFNKMVEWVNNAKRGYQLNPSHLDNIDKHKI